MTQNNIDTNLTILLNRWTSGDKSIENELIQYIYPLIHLAAKKQLNINSDHNTLEATEVVHEAFINLQNQNKIIWKNRNQFLAISTQIIRRIIIDDYRAKNSQKRGGGEQNLTIDRLSSIIVGEIDISFDLLEFDNLLTSLQSIDEEAAKVVELRFYGGLTKEETAQVCGISISNVSRNWSFARSWLLNQLTN